MAILTVHMDLSELTDLDDKLKPAVGKHMREAMQQLSAMTHAHIIERANEVLHTRRQKYIDALRIGEDKDGQFFFVQLDGSARWIEDGMEPHNMLDDLLASDKAKMAKDGSKYIAIPFEHGGGPTQNTPSQQLLLQEIRTELSKRSIPYKKIEMEGGKAKLGLLHSFDITHAPVRPDESRGMGAGPVGAVMQGWSPDRKSGIPLLQGVRIYQKMGKGRKGEDIVKRAIMTFRVASSKHKEQQGRWDHPGLQPINLFEEAVEWAQKTWDREISPAMMDKIIASL